jgi:hypothetical protein
MNVQKLWSAVFLICFGQHSLQTADHFALHREHLSAHLYATSTHRRTFSARPRVGMCRQCARPRARNVRHSGRVLATMRLMSVFLSASKDLLSLEWQASGVIAMCGRVHSPTNVRWITRGRILGECVRRCVEVALNILHHCLTVRSLITFWPWTALNWRRNSAALIFLGWRKRIKREFRSWRDRQS